MKELEVNQERLLKIIFAPHISEKATFLGEKNNQTIFRVALDASKKEIKDAIELLWKDQKITVENVRTITVKGKKKRFGRFLGSRSNWKKAIVSVKEGQELDLNKFSGTEAK